MRYKAVASNNIGHYQEAEGMIFLRSLIAKTCRSLHIYISHIFGV